MTTVLIADDDPKLRKMLARTLTYEGWQVLTAADGLETLAQVDAQRPEIVILDWMMPHMDGLTVVERLRQEGSSVYILMLTARDALENRVQGLESGADDYLVKPFAPIELVARLHALERRLESEPARQTVSVAGLELDPRAHTVSDGGRPLDLTPTEFTLLHTFLRHPRQVLTRAQLLEAVWDYRVREDNVLEVYVGYLRRKLEAEGQPRRLHTVRGIGYVLREMAEG